MKISFFEPYNEVSSNITLNGGPYGYLYLASYLEKNIDQKFEFSIEIDINELIKNKPDIVGISAYTETFMKAITTAQIIKKELNIPVIIGGKHITALPSNLKPCFDVGVLGFGEVSFGEVIQTYIDRKGFFPEDLAKIKGIVFRDGDKLITTPEREALKHLDLLPPPKRDLLFTKLPKTGAIIRWTQALYTSRGCPYKCPFCINSSIPFVVCYHSPQRIVSEIEHIVKNYPEQKGIPIFDELFVLNKKRLRETADLVISEKLNRKVSFVSSCASKLFDEEVAILLKEMSVNYIAFGFESGDDETLQYLKHDSSKVQDNINAINLCNKYGIRCVGFFIIGAPPETKESLTKTYWFIRNNTPPMNIAFPYWLTPYPGTKLWDYAFEKGLVDPETEDWNRYNYFDCDEKSSIFLNENEDLEFYQDVYNNHFLKIYNRIKEIYDQDPIADVSYHETIFSQLKKCNLKYEDKILEVGTYFNKSIKDYFEEEKNITIFDQWIYLSDYQKIKDYEESTTANQKFDVIVFNHSLEQMIKPYEKIEYFVNNHLANGGKLIILVKNPQFIKNVLDLLQGKWEGRFSGNKKHDDYYQVNISDLKENLSKISVKNIEQIPIKEYIKSYEKTFNFIVSIISQKFFINSFSNNADTRSFLFIAEKSESNN